MPLKNQVINKKAEVIERLEKAGAIMLGKLSTGSLARGDVWFKGKTKTHGTYPKAQVDPLPDPPLQHRLV